MSKENSSSNSHTNLESPRKSSFADTRLEPERTSRLSLTSSKRKRSVSREPVDHSDSEYVFIPPLSSSTSHGHGFGKDLGNIDEEVEAETETAEAEADEFGVTRVAKVLRRSPRKRQLPQQVSTITTLGTMKSPSTVSDKRKMLGMSLHGKTGVGGVDIGGSVYRTPSGGIGGTTTTPKRGHVNGSERKTRKVSDLVYSGLGGLGFSGRGFGRDEDGVGDVDGEIHGKQKRARLD
ncbi:MAG: hypothetical protein NXY57DRAFT_1015601 [Lentinula lateritia]|nr:MAG: hypothetical protein NXY57DRAFT_1015601 [Lentinula lateritia]